MIAEAKTILRILEKEACLTLRPLWEEVFYEDSAEFTDYYFREKAKRNRAFALEGAEGMRAMLHLSPNLMLLRSGTGWECREIPYIVGVATKQEYRHRGYMDRLLRAALNDMYENKMPFAFLMPANAAIYEPYQFTYIYDRQEYALREGEGEPVDFMDEKEIPGLMAFATDWLSRHCDVFIRRDEEYYKVLLKELKAQNGGICLLHTAEEGSDGKSEIGGYFLYAKEEEKGEIQEAVSGDASYEAGREPRLPFLSRAEKTPMIMARIVDVKEMLSLLRAKDGEVEVVVEIDDPILAANNGRWRCKWSAQRSCIQKLSHTSECLTKPTEEQSSEAETEAEAGNGVEILHVTIQNLTAWVFGYQSAKICFEIAVDGEETEVKGSESKKRRLLEQLAKVQVLSRVFINEIV